MFQSIKLVNVIRLTFRKGILYVGVMPTVWEYVFYFAVIQLVEPTMNDVISSNCYKDRLKKSEMQCITNSALLWERGQQQFYFN